MSADSRSTTTSWTGWENQLVDGRFPLRRCLGFSDHSAVFLTEHKAKNLADAAIKFVRADASQAKTLLVRWQAAMGLSHPHLIPLFEVGRWQVGGHEFLFVVMEYGEQTLAEILRRRALSVEEVLELLPPALDALTFLHRRQLVHGRLKPANLLAAADQLKLSSDTIRPAGQDADVSLAGDVWSLGATLVEALTRRVLGSGDPPFDVAALPGGLPASFVETVRRCLSPAPADRPTVIELRAEYKLAPAPSLKVPAQNVSRESAPVPLAPSTSPGTARPHVATEISRATDSAGPAPSTSRDRAPTQLAPNTSQAAAPSQVASSVLQAAVLSKPAPNASQSAASSQPGPNISQVAAPSQLAPNALQSVAPSQPAPNASQAAAPSPQAHIASRAGAPSQRAHSASQAPAPSQRVPNASQAAAPSEPVPNISQSAALSQPAPDTSQWAAPPQPAPDTLQWAAPPQPASNMSRAAATAQPARNASQAATPPLPAPHASRAVATPGTSKPRESVSLLTEHRASREGARSPSVRGTSNEVASAASERSDLREPLRSSARSVSQKEPVSGARSASKEREQAQGGRGASQAKAPAQSPRSGAQEAASAPGASTASKEEARAPIGRSVSHQETPAPGAGNVSKEEASPPSGAKRHRLIAAIVAGALISLTIWGGSQFLNNSRSQPQPTQPNIAPAPTPDIPSAPQATESTATLAPSPTPLQEPPSSTPATVLHEVTPTVPEKILSTIQGRFYVTVRVLVGPDGTVVGALLEDAGPSKYFARISEQAARQWQFIPADTVASRVWLLHFEYTRDGVAVRTIEQ